MYVSVCLPVRPIISPKMDFGKIVVEYLHPLHDFLFFLIGQYTSEILNVEAFRL